MTTSTDPRDAGRVSSVVGAARSFGRAVRADYEAMRAGRAKYLGDQLSAGGLPFEAVKKIGFQMLIAIRAMQALRDARVPLGAQVASRMIRYVYGAEIHWDAQIAPGVGIVHGNGLVIGNAVSIDEGCVILHNVTLGSAFDPATGTIGGPSIGRNVHIGPGATIIGKITVGEGSKIMAGSVLERSVPPGSLVSPAPVHVALRGGGKSQGESGKGGRA